MPSLSQRSCMASLRVQRQIEAAEGGLAGRQGSTEGPSSLDGPRRTNLGELGATRSGGSSLGSSGSVRRGGEGQP
jgi:hypothetical protein